MTDFLMSIFAPYSGKNTAVRERVEVSAARQERAANRLEQTIDDMLSENDRVTGRRELNVRKSGD
ncbi:MAG: hypothetical protein H0U23_07335 [Blastocatellia bacterium]|nr:hypothetical protein [Blastocatellia bacterium]